MSYFKKNNKIPCLIMAIESYIGQGRNMEIYYRTLLSSKIIAPIMVYTDQYAYANAPNWINNKILTASKKTDHELKDCRKFSCLKIPSDHYTNKQWNQEYVPHVVALRKQFGERTLWLRDCTNEKIERYMGRYIIQVFHGELFDIPRGHFDNETAKNYNRFWLIFTPGRLLKNRTVRKLNLSSQDKRFISIGRVLNDTLYNGEIQRRTVFQKMNLSPRKKTILYAPSWKSGKIWPIGKSTKDQQKLMDFCKKAQQLNVNVILRPHPVSIHHHGVKKSYIDATKKFKNVFFDDTTHSNVYGPNESLVIADILITDVSSIAVDFMSLGKPSIFIYPNSKRRLWGRLPTYEKVKKVSYVVRTFPSLFLLLKKLLMLPESKLILQKRKHVVRPLLEITDGTSGDIFRDRLELAVKQISFKDYLNMFYIKRLFLFYFFFVKYSLNNIRSRYALGVG